MFDIGFAELLVCAIVALLVLGPERLPGAVRTVGRWVGRARHTVNQFTDQIDREIRADELKRRIEEELKKSGVNDVARQVKEALHAPLPAPLIGADHLREDGNRIAPPASPPAQSASAEDHADVAPALQAQRAAGLPVSDSDDDTELQPARPAAATAAVSPAAEPVAVAVVAEKSPSPAIPNAQGHPPA